MRNSLKFYGDFEVSMDEKSRIMIPSKWKNFVEKEMILREGYDDALELWNRSSFESKYESLIRNDFPTSYQRILTRKMLGSARDVQLDKWYRFLIPTRFKKNFQDGVLLIGNGTFIEIWNKKDYEEWASQEENSIEKATEEISKQYIPRKESFRE